MHVSHFELVYLCLPQLVYASLITTHDSEFLVTVSYIFIGYGVSDL